MSNEPSIELTIRYGTYGEQQKTVAIPIDEYLMRELMGRVELSDEPFSLMLASPGLFGGKGDAVTMRRKTFTMRRDVAQQISKAMASELVKAFGVNDELDGYRVADLSNEEIAHHTSKGRL